MKHDQYSTEQHFLNFSWSTHSPRFNVTDYIVKSSISFKKLHQSNRVSYLVHLIPCCILAELPLPDFPCFHHIPRGQPLKSTLSLPTGTDRSDCQPCMCRRRPPFVGCPRPPPTWVCLSPQVCQEDLCEICCLSLATG